jgi:hypothetical protein
MFGCVFVFRGVATAHMSAGKTEPQVNPSVTQFHAILANVLIRCPDLNLVHVLAVHSVTHFLFWLLSRCPLSYFPFSVVPARLVAFSS